MDETNGPVVRYSVGSFFLGDKDGICGIEHVPHRLRFLSTSEGEVVDLYDMQELGETFSINLALATRVEWERTSM